MKKIGLLLLCTLTLLSCKKDRLKGKKDLLVGKWEWSYTESIGDFCSSISYTYIYNPQTDNRNYSVEFIKKGVVDIYIDGAIYSNGNIKFHNWEKASGILSNYYAFEIFVDNDEDKTIMGYVSEDTLILGKSYFFDHDNDCYVNGERCCANTSYYTKQ